MEGSKTEYSCPYAYDFTEMQEEVSDVVKNVIFSTLNGKVFSNSKVQSWIDEIGDSVLSRLKGLNENFKLVVLCVISEQNGAGISTSVTSLCDDVTDGCCTIKWGNESIQCIVSVFAAAL